MWTSSLGSLAEMNFTNFAMRHTPPNRHRPSVMGVARR
jgi:hypothetical protein